MASTGIPTALLIVLAVVALAIGVVVYRKIRNNRIRRLLASQWGEPPERKPSPDELLSIRRQAEALAGGFAVDDITWGDLDMDRLYGRVNAAYTDAGDHALYGMLRNPAFSAEELKRRAEIMAWAKADAAGRERVKRTLYNLGRAGNIDIAVLREGKPLSGKRWLGYAALSASLAVCLALVAAGVGAALFPAVALAVTNCVISLRSRMTVGKYYSMYEFIPSVLSAAGRVAKTDAPALAGTRARISEDLGRIKGILGNALLNFYYSSSGQNASSPADVILVTFNYFFLLNLISLYNLSRNVAKYRAEILDVYEALGETDALIAAASWRETLPQWCEPVLDASRRDVRLSFEDLAHPMLEEPVPNSAVLRRNLLLTGSNATGKSTFLKAVAMNAILAQSLFTCTARAWAGNFVRVYTSMALKDDLFAGESYFIREIRSLKRMLDSSSEEPPSLCIVDEVLRGTNTGERIAAASEALTRFSGGNCLCLAATHDIELTHILDGVYENMHFTETVNDGAISFDYKLRPGRSTSRNAIKLLDLLGYGEALVGAANRRLEEFERTGRWGRAGHPEEPLE